MEKKLNVILFINIAIILLLAGLMAGLNFNFLSKNESNLDYIFPEDDTNIYAIASQSFASYYLLFNTLIPLSIIVLIEFAKMIYAKMMEVDADMIVIDEHENEIKHCRA